MMYWYGGSWWAWLAMGLGMVAFWGAVIWLVWNVVTHGTPHGESPATSTPERILDERFARGELDVDEYRARRDALR